MKKILSIVLAIIIICIPINCFAVSADQSYATIKPDSYWAEGSYVFKKYNGIFNETDPVFSINNNVAEFSYPASSNSLLIIPSIAGRYDPVLLGLDMKLSTTVYNNRGGTYLYFMISSINTYYNVLYSLKTTDVSFREYLESLYNYQDIFSSDQDWLFIEKYDIGTSSSLIDCNFKLPADYESSTFAITIFDSISDGINSGDCVLQVGQFDLYPVGNSVKILAEYQAEKDFKEDLIGSDEDGEESGIKGIFKKIKELPSQIGGFITGIGDRISGFFDELKSKLTNLFDQLISNIKHLFLPEPDELNQFKTDFGIMLQDHLGSLYEVDLIVKDVIDHLLDFDPPSFDQDDDDYDLAFPAKSVFINSDTEDWDISDQSDGNTEFVLIPDNGEDGMYHVDLSFLSISPYSTIYGIYKAFVIVLILFMMIQFARHEYDKIMGGNV